MILLILLVTGAVTLFVHMANSNKLRIEQDKKTDAALAQAKEALIGFAVKAALDNCSSSSNNCPRPGDLPCPDLDDDGKSELSCGNGSGTTGQEKRIGRLPWITLGLPDLRDGDGERLWYAVSNNFKNNTRTSCTDPSSAACLNSDSAGTISIRQTNGQLILDASDSKGAVAVIFAPGRILRRQNAIADQDRSCTNCTATGQCTTSPASLTPKCNPLNYLDAGNGEDNANFTDGTIDGFISGNIVDPAQPANLIVNDKFLSITTGELIPLLEKRVAGEVLSCLAGYAAENGGRHPWAATLDGSAAPVYTDTDNALFGRIPDFPFDRTQTSSATTMSNDWPLSGCAIVSLPILHQPNWWLNWKESVFYGLADAYKPASTGIFPICGACLDVYITPTTPLKNKQVVVIVAGKTLAGQSRASSTNKADPSNYLEGFNSDATAAVFQKGTVTSTFNDHLLFR